MNKLLWGLFTISLIMVSIYYTVKLKFPQFKFRKMIMCFRKNESTNVSAFQTLMLTLAAKIGVGSLAGIALSIYIGGPGTIFWIWISTIIVIPSAYVESYLAVKYHKRNTDNYYEGGPSYYIKYGLGNSFLAGVYSVLVLLAYLIGFITIQSNTISHSITMVPNYHLLIGIGLSILTGLVIFNGIKGIVNLTSVMMPIVGIFFILISLFVVFKYINLIPSIVCLIIDDAFHPRAIGIGIISSIIIGIQRSVFSHESGVGSGAISAALVDSDNAASQGMVQMVGVYFTGIILCTLSAFLVLLSDYQQITFTNINGIEITQFAFNFHLGTFGNIFLLIMIFCFAFSTIITSYYYSENSLKYLLKRKGVYLIAILRIMTMVFIILGSVANPSFLWSLVDIFIALMGILNIYVLWKLRDEVN